MRYQNWEPSSSSRNSGSGSAGAGVSSTNLWAARTKSTRLDGSNAFRHQTSAVENCPAQQALAASAVLPQKCVAGPTACGEPSSYLQSTALPEPVLLSSVQPGASPVDVNGSMTTRAVGGSA